MKTDLFSALVVMILCGVGFYLGKRIEWAYREAKNESVEAKDKYSRSWFEWEGKIKAYIFIIIGVIVSIYLIVT